MKEAIKSLLNYAGTGQIKKKKEKKEKDFLLQSAFNKRLKFLSWLTEASPNHKDRSLQPTAPLDTELRQGL